MTAQTREEILRAYWDAVERIDSEGSRILAPLKASLAARLGVIRAERDRKLAELEGKG